MESWIHNCKYYDLEYIILSTFKINIPWGFLNNCISTSDFSPNVSLRCLMVNLLGMLIMSATSTISLPHFLQRKKSEEKKKHLLSKTRQGITR